MLAHELRHTLQAAVGPDRSRDRVTNEVDAFQMSGFVWSTASADEELEQTSGGGGLMALINGR